MKCSDVERRKLEQQPKSIQQWPALLACYVCLLGLTFLEGIFCHELHCLPTPVRSVGVLCLLFWQASLFDECSILNGINVNPFTVDRGDDLKVSFEIVMALCCGFKQFFPADTCSSVKGRSFKIGCNLMIVMSPISGLIYFLWIH